MSDIRQLQHAGALRSSDVLCLREALSQAYSWHSDLPTYSRPGGLDTHSETSEFISRSFFLLRIPEYVFLRRHGVENTSIQVIGFTGKVLSWLLSYLRGGVVTFIRMRRSITRPEHQQ